MALAHMIYLVVTLNPIVSSTTQNGLDVINTHTQIDTNTYNQNQHSITTNTPNSSKRSPGPGPGALARVNATKGGTIKGDFAGPLQSTNKHLGGSGIINYSITPNNKGENLGGTQNIVRKIFLMFIFCYNLFFYIFIFVLFY